MKRDKLFFGIFLLNVPFSYSSCIYGLEILTRSLTYPVQSAINPITGDIYVTDQYYHTIKKLNVKNPSVIRLFAGSHNVAGYRDGPVSGALFHEPYGIEIDATWENLFVTEFGNHLIRKISILNASVETLVGDGRYGTVDGSFLEARLGGPLGIILDNEKSILYVSEFANNIRKIDLKRRMVSTLAGTSTTGSIDGYQASFNFPLDLAFYTDGNLLVADGGNNKIRLVNLTNGYVSTFAGSSKGYKEGNGVKAQFFGITGLSVEPGGSILVADQGNYRIRRIDTQRNTATVLGNGISGSKSGIGGSAQFGGLYMFSNRDFNGSFYCHDFYGGALMKVYYHNCTNDTTTVKTTTTLTTKRTISNVEAFSSLYPSDAEQLLQNTSGPIVIAIGILALTFISSILFYINIRIKRNQYLSSLRIGSGITKTTKSVDKVSDTVTISATESGNVALPGYLSLTWGTDFSIDETTVNGAGGSGLIFNATIENPALIEKYGIREAVAKVFKIDSEVAPNQIKEFKFEVALMNTLSRAPNIVKFLGYCESPHLVILMKKYPFSLSQVIKNEQLSNDPYYIKNEVTISTKIGHDICVGMMSLHNYGILHLDLKPQNILIEMRSDHTFDCVICDFGCSRLIGEKSVKGLEIPNQLGFTPRYTSPEIFRRIIFSNVLANACYTDADKKIDVYSFAIVMFEILTKRLAWEGCSSQEIQELVLNNQRPEFPSQVLNLYSDSPWITVIQKCWSHDPIERPLFHNILFDLNITGK